VSAGLQPHSEPSAGPAVDLDQAPQDQSRFRRIERRVAGALFAALVVLGVPLGAVWELISPPGPLGVRLPAGIQADESQAFVEADGRYAVIVLIVGLVAGVVAWLLKAARGVLLAVALTAGTLAGSLIADLVGHLLRGQGPTQQHGGLTYYEHLPLQVRMPALLLLESVVALLVYAVCVAFAARDDLGRPDG
jgi:hypothetical protein